MSTSEAVARPLADPDVYPYFVLRHISTVYSRRKWYVEPEHLLPGGLITEEGRAEFVEFVAGLSTRTGKRACAVFGPDDAVYCEPDGSRRTTDPGERAPDGYTYI